MQSECQRGEHHAPVGQVDRVLPLVGAHSEGEAEAGESRQEEEKVPHPNIGQAPRIRTLEWMMRIFTQFVA